MGAGGERGHPAAKSPAAAKFQFFSPEQAAEIDAITARIIPSDETPGAREAGVVYFIDRALTTFAVDDQQTYRDGLPSLQARVHELFPAIEKFALATRDQQDQILHSVDDQAVAGRGNFRANTKAKPFFETVRVHTTVGFLIHPDAGHCGNRDGLCCKL